MYGNVCDTNIAILLYKTPISLFQKLRFAANLPHSQNYLFYSIIAIPHPQAIRILNFLFYLKICTNHEYWALIRQSL